MTSQWVKQFVIGVLTTRVIHSNQIEVHVEKKQAKLVHTTQQIEKKDYVLQLIVFKAES